MMMIWMFQNKFVLFCWASLTGIFFALVCNKYEHTISHTLSLYRIRPSRNDYEGNYDSWLRQQGLKRAYVHPPAKNLNSPKQITEDVWLFKEVTVLCVVLTYKIKNGKAIKNTWASRCNRILFYGPYNDDALPVNKIKYSNEWELLCQAVFRAWKGYGDEYMWTVFVDDNTFVLVENLRFMVASLNSNESLYLGHPLHGYFGQYNDEEGGLVLSRAALAALGNKFDNPMNPQGKCAKLGSNWQNKDKTLGSILQEVGITPQDTRDRRGRARFLTQNLEKLLIPGSISIFSKYWSDSVYLSGEGSDCCSDFAVTFHGITPNKMYMMDYVIYRLKPITMLRSRSIEEPDAPGSELQDVTAKPTRVKSNIAKPPVGKAFISELGKTAKAVLVKGPSNDNINLLAKKPAIESKISILNLNNEKLPQNTKINNEINNNIDVYDDIKEMFSSKSWWTSANNNKSTKSKNGR